MHKRLQQPLVATPRTSLDSTTRTHSCTITVLTVLSTVTCSSSASFFSSMSCWYIQRPMLLPGASAVSRKDGGTDGSL